MNKIVHLEITSWQGMSFGAEHYYGKLIHSGESYEVIELEKTMSIKEAKRLSTKDHFHYKAGHKTSRFDTKDEIIELAKLEFRKHFPGAEILILGRNSYREPKLVLVAPPKIQEKLNKIYEKHEKIPWIERYGFYYRNPKDEDLIDELSDKYYKILKEYS